MKEDNIKVYQLNKENAYWDDCVIVEQNDDGDHYKYKSSLRDGSAYGAGNTIKESILSLSSYLRKQADKIDKLAEEITE